MDSSFENCGPEEVEEREGRAWARGPGSDLHNQTKFPGWDIESTNATKTEYTKLITKI